jgi:threonine dehydrogenase-like Zn-dependent dehydrogenase
MMGIVFPSDRTIAYVDVPDPSPGPLDVVIEMKASCICGTDLQNYRRPRDQGLYMPPLIDRAPIAGHKPAGIVCAVDAAVPAEQTRISNVSWCTTIRATQPAIIAAAAGNSSVNA